MTIHTSVRTSVVRVLHDRNGVSATEYTLMVVGIAALVLAGASAMGNSLSSALSRIGSYVSSQGAGV